MRAILGNTQLSGFFLANKKERRKEKEKIRKEKREKKLRESKGGG